MDENRILKTKQIILDGTDVRMGVLWWMCSGGCALVGVLCVSEETGVPRENPPDLRVD